MMAGVLFPPDLVTMRQNFPLRKQSFLAAAAQAHSVSTVRSQGLPPVVRLLLFFPALRLLPGQTPAHELRSLAEGNCSTLALGCRERRGLIFRPECWFPSRQTEVEYLYVGVRGQKDVFRFQIAVAAVD